MFNFLRRLVMSFPDDASKRTGKPTVSDVLLRTEYPAEWPFTERDFRRSDENADSSFYRDARIGIFHIDDQAVRALTRFYDNTLPTGDGCHVHILDLCSSWVSHLPDDRQDRTITLSILGMNDAELKANERATKRVVHDLNKDATLPFADNSFDVVTNVVSVDYLTKPLEVFREMRRVLRPGGRAIMSFSNRCFPTKVIDIWARTDDVTHVLIVGCYFHFAGGFEPAVAHDLKPGLFGFSDPMYVVEATKVTDG